MKKIIYEIKGKIEQIEVSDEFAAAYAEITADEQRRVWREKKRKESSLDALCEAGYQIKDPNADIEEIVWKKEICEIIRNAIRQLSPEQRELIIRIFYNNESQTKIAKEYGIERNALHNRLDRALKKLKNFIESDRVHSSAPFPYR